MKSKTKLFKFWGRWSAVVAPACVVVNSHADGIEGNGSSTHSSTTGGANFTWTSDSIAANAVDPTSFGYLNSPDFNLSVNAGLLNNNSEKSGVSSFDLENSLRAFPEGVVAYPVKALPVTIVLSVAPGSTSLSDWRYVDLPGGLSGNSAYGDQSYIPEIVLLRSALGASVQISDRLSVGASVGLLYNENPLVEPNVFQDLSSSGDLPYENTRTLWNFQSAGVGWNVMVGLVFKATSDVQFGLSYRSAAAVTSTGNNGDPFAQFVPRNMWVFDYNSDIKYRFPKEWSTGASWNFSPKWRADLQVDWISWYNAFEVLPFVGYTWGNTTYNENNWGDSLVYRAGLEYELNDRLDLRAGYAYGQNPVPDSTFLPMTAETMEHTFSVGIGYHWRRLHMDLAYQYALPVSQNASNSLVDATSHMVALTAGVRF
jgi:opacity protein-like surface antigen